jgi:glycosyltransferase involved in cell wall biosynthesis
MKLLIITQKVDINDDLLGFFHGWIREFGKQCESVKVICLYKGEYNLPENVEVLSLGKKVKSQKSKVKITIQNLKVFRLIFRLKYFYNFYSHIWTLRNDYNAVFVHMNPEYVVLGGVPWKLMNKKIALWFTHKSVNFNLRIAEKFADVIFTASKESFRLPSRKVRVVGHGIDINKFKVKSEKYSAKGGSRANEFIEAGKISNIFNIISVGRISPIKDYETLIEAADILVKSGEKNFRISIIGGPGLAEQEAYFDKLKKIVREKQLSGHFDFLGSLPNTEIPAYLKKSDLFVHMSHTGSLDKAILEAMASGIPVVSCNDASRELLSEFEKYCIFPPRDYMALKDKIAGFMKMEQDERARIASGLFLIVSGNHSLDKLIDKIIKDYSSV